MPLRYKIPGYLGNGLLLLLSLVILAQGKFLIGVLFSSLSVLNLFLVYKLDQFSREDVWLAHELKLEKMREELLIEEARVQELEKARCAPEDTGSPGGDTPGSGSDQDGKA